MQVYERGSALLVDFGYTQSVVDQNGRVRLKRGDGKYAVPAVGRMAVADHAVSVPHTKKGASGEHCITAGGKAADVALGTGDREIHVCV